MKNFALLPSLVWRWTETGEAQRNEEGSLLALLAGIAETGSVAQAARASGFSYRHAWGLIRAWEERLAQPLVDMARGRGSSLAPMGLQLVQLDARLQSRFAAQLAEATAEVRRELKQYRKTNTPRVTVHASHDPMLARLPEALREHRVAMETHVLGSSESLASFAAGRCDLAGFHCPEGRLGKPIWQDYRKYLNARSHVLIQFAKRLQGLMLTPRTAELFAQTRSGKQLPLRNLQILSKHRLRFVNRQAGSGTRMLLDLLLGESDIKSSDINGYANEEFTHAAVAATIASGAADAGLGVEAAAHRFGLDFIPLARENYFLAVRRDALTHPGLIALIEVLSAPKWQEVLAAEPGYDAQDCGMLVECVSAWR
ncbi:MAG: substrate-binding domain-containing protein [Sterolibacterium sp.]